MVLSIERKDERVLSMLALTPLEKVINMYLHLDPEMVEQMSQMPSKVIAIELTATPCPLVFYVRPERGHLKLYHHYEDEIDTWISGSPVALMKMGLAKDVAKSRSLFVNEVIIRGDVEFAHEFKALMDNIDIDWEEQASYLLGDVLAHQLGHGVASVGSYLDKLKTTVQNNITEFLQEESSSLPPAEAVMDFVDHVDQLAMAVARLDARVKRLIVNLGEES